jgi:hypothetical protein
MCVSASQGGCGGGLSKFRADGSTKSLKFPVRYEKNGSSFLALNFPAAATVAFWKTRNSMNIIYG